MACDATVLRENPHLGVCRRTKNRQRRLRKAGLGEVGGRCPLVLKEGRGSGSKWADREGICSVGSATHRKVNRDKAQEVSENF